MSSTNGKHLWVWQWLLCDLCQPSLPASRSVCEMMMCVCVLLFLYVCARYECVADYKSKPDYRIRIECASYEYIFAEQIQRNLLAICLAEYDWSNCPSFFFILRWIYLYFFHVWLLGKTTERLTAIHANCSSSLSHLGHWTPRMNESNVQMQVSDSAG